jgi:hypothetical protein
MCDASGAVPIDERHFVVVDDEDNILRLYDAERGGAPLQRFDLSEGLSLRRRQEADIEAATRLGDQAYFLSSHGRKRSGKLDASRYQFFATTLPGLEQGVSVLGAPYRSLVRDLISEPALAAFDLARAEAAGELSLEGMTATPDAELLLGFRSPVPKGQALMVRLSNPAAITRGEPPHLAGAQAFDLHGRGIRGLSSWRGNYLLLAGPAGEGGAFELYRWPEHGHATPQSVPDMPLEGLSPEGFFSHDARAEVMVLSDDGTRAIDGVACKRLKQQSKKHFRGVWLRLL